MRHAWRRTEMYRVLVETSEEKRPLGRPVSGWEDNCMLR